MNVDLGWTLKWQDETWTFAALTGEEVALLTGLLSDDWKALSPSSSPVALASHLAVHLAHIHGAEVEDVFASLRKRPFVELMGALGQLGENPAAGAADRGPSGDPAPTAGAPSVPLDHAA